MIAQNEQQQKKEGPDFTSPSDFEKLYVPDCDRNGFIEIADCDNCADFLDRCLVCRHFCNNGDRLERFDPNTVLTGFRDGVLLIQFGGRIGPLILFFLLLKKKKDHFRYPYDQVFAG